MLLDEVKIILIGSKKFYIDSNDPKWEYIFLAHNSICTKLLDKWSDVKRKPNQLSTLGTQLESNELMCTNLYGHINDIELADKLSHKYPNNYIYDITLIQIPDDMDYHRFIHQNYIIYRMIEIHNVDVNLKPEIESKLKTMIQYIKSKGIELPYMAIYIYTLNCIKKGYTMDLMHQLLYKKNLYYCSLYSYGYEFVKHITNSDWNNIKYILSQ